MLDAELGTLVRRVQREQGSPRSLPSHALAGLLDAITDRPGLWQPCVRHEPACRWFGSLYRDDVVDLWLLTWQQDNSTDLHDHGGSRGAFRVLEGSLAEDRPRGLSGEQYLHRTRRTAGSTVAFGPGLVHDVHNVDAAPAVSLHVYSPPLTAMTYYDIAGGSLAARHTEPVDVRPDDGEVPGRAITVDA